MTSLIEPTVVYNINTGAVTMNAVDAHSAVSQHPNEWSLSPWSQEVVERVQANMRREAELNAVPVVGALPKTEE